MTGEASHVFSLSAGLARRGHRVLIGCRTQRKGRPVTLMLDRAQESPEAETIELLLERGWSLRTDLADLGTLDRLCHSRPELQIIHTHRSKEHWLATLLRRKHPRIRVVRTRHVVTPTRRHVFNRWLYRNTDAVIASSTAIRDGLAASGIRRAEEMAVIHGGVDTTRFRPGVSGELFRQQIGIGPEIPLVLAVGHLDPVKGYKVLLAAFVRVHQALPEARLVIVGGSGSLSPLDLMNEAMNLGIGENTILTGERPDVPDIMAACTLGVISSIGSEGNSRVALEFLASEKPLIATTVGCLPDLVKPGQTGILVPPSDPEALAEAITALLVDPPRGRQLGEAGRALVESKYTEDLVAEKLEDLYRSLVKS
jgi:glycosyltransferase involved in cell wall biosynthesis